MPSRRPQGGFTLTEILIALAIFSIGAAFAVPAFGDLVARQRLSASANEALSVLNYARMEAIRQRERVVACPTRTGNACDGGTNWGRAIVFTDLNRDGLRNGSEAVTRRWDFSNTDVSVVQVDGGSPARVTVGGTGLVLPAPGEDATRMVLCSQRVPEVSIELAAGVGGATTQRGDGDGC